MKNDFKFKVVVITGATGGIGRALAWRFSQASSRIVLIDLDEQQLSALENQVERSGTEVMSIQCDITNYERCVQAMQQVEDRFGGIDVLVNNAGITHYSSFENTDMSVIRRVMEVNYFGAIHCTKAALRSLSDRKGLVITMSSIAGLAPLPLRSGYSGSKHALHGLFESFRVELCKKGVQVIMICPGTTDTDLRKNAMSGKGGAVDKPAAPKVMNNANAVAERVFSGAVAGKRTVLIQPKGGVWNWLLWRIAPNMMEKSAYQSFCHSLEAEET